MPESEAIRRTRDAMNAWLAKDLPEDFDQLRTDLRHILDCIPETHQRADDIKDHFQWTHGPGHIAIHCLQCGWEKHLDVQGRYAISEIVELRRHANNHLAGHQ